jgi:hypothetical protein
MITFQFLNLSICGLIEVAPVNDDDDDFIFITLILNKAILYKFENELCLFHHLHMQLCLFHHLHVLLCIDP